MSKNLLKQYQNVTQVKKDCVCPCHETDEPCLIICDSEYSDVCSFGEVDDIYDDEQ